MEDEPLESVLNDCLVWMRHQHLLKWHYRSKDDALIAFSNHEFYNNRLVTFPNPGAQERQLGVKLIYCPDGVFDRGRSRTNRVEAVEAAVREHTPDDDILERAYRFEGNGTLNLCHHKLFRRWDIILSSIGAAGWAEGWSQLTSPICAVMTPAGCYFGRLRGPSVNTRRL